MAPRRDGRAALLLERDALGSRRAGCARLQRRSRRVDGRRGGRSGRDGSPGVREAILARLGRLKPAASMLLAAAAVLGRPSDFEDLRRVAGMDEDEGLSALEEALASGLLREVAGDAAPPANDGPDAYVCAHDKIRDVIYTEAGGARRRVYHRRALRKLEVDEGASAAELARLMWLDFVRYHELEALLRG